MAPFSQPPDTAAPIPLAACTAPLAGLMLILLVVWMASLPRLDHAVSLQMDAHCPEPLPPPPRLHQVLIDADNVLWWDGQRMRNRAELEGRLQGVGAMDVGRRPGIRVEAAPMADYRSFVAVLASAQRLGVTRLDIAGGGLLPTMDCPLVCHAIE